MIAQNRKMQEEGNKIASKVNALKKAARVTMCGISFVKLLESTLKLTRDRKASYDPINPLIQVLLYLSTDTIKDAFYHLGRNNGELSDQNKQTVAAEIVRKWGQSILLFLSF